MKIVFVLISFLEEVTGLARGALFGSDFSAVSLAALTHGSE
jgi:hypothetical protein